jgi:hypothetical protein
MGDFNCTFVRRKGGEMSVVAGLTVSTWWCVGEAPRSLWFVWVVWVVWAVLTWWCVGEAPRSLWFAWSV